MIYCTICKKSHYFHMLVTSVLSYLISYTQYFLKSMHTISDFKRMRLLLRSITL